MAAKLRPSMRPGGVTTQAGSAERKEELPLPPVSRRSRPTPTTMSAPTCSTSKVSPPSGKQWQPSIPSDLPSLDNSVTRMEEVQVEVESMGMSNANMHSTRDVEPKAQFSALWDRQTPTVAIDRVRGLRNYLDKLDHATFTVSDDEESTSADSQPAGQPNRSRIRKACWAEDESVETIEISACGRRRRLSSISRGRKPRHLPGLPQNNSQLERRTPRIVDLRPYLARMHRDNTDEDDSEFSADGVGSCKGGRTRPSLTSINSELGASLRKE
eukprot:TRINITY_DN45358_c0_g1_i2.p1 TRINITY_DN45358_c0_g1~~TRINITY_DN45358_c0_g1_i2.p1  ORF type:complete len:271 (-),score=23.30 TRINITY_DN45358_c0_g1_i2:228-1040(-)